MQPESPVRRRGAVFASVRHAITLRYCLFAIAVSVLCGGASHAADIFKGSQIYSRHCAGCHGPGGVSLMPGAPHLARGEKMMQPDLALLATLKAGRNAMPAYIGVLSDAELLDVIAYSRSLR